MLFNSLDFALFLPLVFALYWSMQRLPLRYQNLFLVAASYLFYGWWDPRFLALIVASSLVDYIVGIKLEKGSNKKPLLLLSLAVNIGALWYFKYFGFFAENFADAFSLFGTKLHVPTLDIVLPVGISFYTFQTLSYSIDVYRGRIPATKNLVAFLAFVSFFPSLLQDPLKGHQVCCLSLRKAECLESIKPKMG